MIVETIEHGKRVFESIISRQKRAKMKIIDVSLDTETESKPGYENNKKSALIYGRAKIKIWSACYRGESYSFPTNLIDESYPTMAEWGEAIIRPLAENPEITKVGANFKYDQNVFNDNIGPILWKNVWCVMTGAWMANPAKEKGLKSRAPAYGRHLRKTKTINFDDLADLAEYAEEDVVQTDEQFQMQVYGKIERPQFLRYLRANGSYHIVKNNLPHGTIVIPGEHCTAFGKNWLNLVEFPVIRAARRAETRGFKFNVPKIRAIRKKLEVDKEASLRRIFRLAGGKFNLNSSKQKAQVLNGLGIHSPYVTKKGAESFSEKALLLIKDEHSIIENIVNYTRLNKLNSVYVSKKGLEHYVNPATGAIHCSMSTVGAVTGRFSVSLPNLTQIPSKRDTYGIKECFVARKGKRIVCLDYAQLELRIMGILSGDKTMIRLLSDPENDMHQYTADNLNVDRDPTAKQLNFLLQYGGGAYMLSRKLTEEGVPTTKTVAQAYINGYDETYPGVSAYRKRLLDDHQRDGHIKLLTGRRRWLEDVDWANPGALHKAETTLSNNVVQGSGQDMLKAAIVRSQWRDVNIDKAALLKLEMPTKHKALISDYARKLNNKIRPALKLAKTEWLLQVHDESLWEVDEKAAEDIGHILADLMTWRHYFPSITPYTIPLAVDGGIGVTWKQAKGKTPEVKLEAGFGE